MLDAIREAYAVQPPDLFVFVPKTSRYWFAEVKGPDDRLSVKQIRSHDAITRELGVPVEIIEVKILRPHRLPNYAVHRPGARVARSSRWARLLDDRA